MIMKAGKYQERLQNALDSLELTEHNRQLADRYLDLSEPEDRNFWRMQRRRISAGWTKVSAEASIIRSWSIRRRKRKSWQADLSGLWFGSEVRLPDR